MAFDWTKVEGYREDMTPEEKLALLDNDKEDKPPEMPAPKEEPKPNNGVVSKVQFDKVSSELAALKKQLKSKMTDDEQKEADRLAAEEALKTELETLRREKTLNSHKASFLAQGYSEQLAEQAATAMVDNDSNSLFAVMTKQKAESEKAMRAKILKETPTPPNGDNTDKTKEMAELRKSFGLPPTK